MQHLNASMRAHNAIHDENFKLHRLTVPHPSANADDYLKSIAHQQTSIKTLCLAVQNQCSMSTLKWYLEQRKGNDEDFEKNMKKHACPVLYYAVERNSAEAVGILLEHGADPEDYHLCFPIPLLAFAIIQGRRAIVNTTGVVKQLLAYNASPKVIPQDMWIRYLDAPKGKGPIYRSGPTSWCDENARAELAPALHLTHRYSLYRASMLKKPKAREIQVAAANKMLNMLKIPYFLIGQLPPAELVMTRLFSHIADRNENPLVMAFAGASGHGKTELAIQMGNLLSVKHIVIDCAQLRDRMDLLGASHGYFRNDEGSELNNFIAENNGKRAVVFLDEFDKTEQVVRDSLLEATDKGIPPCSESWSAMLTLG